MNIINIITNLPLSTFIKVQLLKIYFRKWVFSAVFLVTIIPLTHIFYSMKETYVSTSVSRVITNPYLYELPYLFENVKVNIGEGKFWNWEGTLRAEYINTEFYQRLIEKIKLNEITGKSTNMLVSEIEKKLDLWVSTPKTLDFSFTYYDPGISYLLAYYAPVVYSEIQNDRVLKKLDNVLVLLDEQLSKMNYSINEKSVKLFKLRLKYTKFIENRKEFSSATSGKEGGMFSKMEALIIELNEVENSLKIARIKEQNYTRKPILSNAAKVNMGNNLDLNKYLNIKQLKKKEQSLIKSLEKLGRVYTINHPAIKTKEAELMQVENSIAAFNETDDFIKSSFGKQVKTVNNVAYIPKTSDVNYLLLKAEVDSLLKRKSILISNVSQQEKTIKAYLNIKNQYTQNKEYILKVFKEIESLENIIGVLSKKRIFLTGKVNKFKNSYNSMQASSSVQDYILTFSQYNPKPTGPNRLIHDIVIFSLSILLGSVFVVIISFMGKGFYLQEEVESKFNIEVIGTINDFSLLNNVKAEKVLTLVSLGLLMVGIIFKISYSNILVEGRKASFIPEPHLETSF